MTPPIDDARPHQPTPTLWTQTGLKVDT